MLQWLGEVFVVMKQFAGPVGMTLRQARVKLLE